MVGGTISNGVERTFVVCGVYWISSNMSVRSTTAPGRDRDVLAHLERVGLHHRRHPRRGREVAHEPASAGDQAAAAGVDRPLEDLGVEHRVVARGRRLDQVVDDEAHPLPVAPAEVGVVDQPAGRLARGQVALEGTTQQRVLGPALLRGEATVLLVGLDVRAAGADPGQLTGQPGAPSYDAERVTGEPGREPDAGHARQEPAQRAARGVGQQQVERRGRVGLPLLLGLERAHQDDASVTSSGASTSRRRILPVGPLGSSSTIQMCRGYL